MMVESVPSAFSLLVKEAVEEVALHLKNKELNARAQKKSMLAFTHSRHMQVKDMSKAHILSLINDMLFSTSNEGVFGVDSLFYLLDRNVILVQSARGGAKKLSHCDRLLMRTATGFLVGHSRERLLRVFLYMTKCVVSEPIDNATCTREEYSTECVQRWRRHLSQATVSIPELSILIEKSVAAARTEYDDSIKQVPWLEPFANKASLKLPSRLNAADGSAVAISADSWTDGGVTPSSLTASPDSFAVMLTNLDRGFPNTERASCSTRPKCQKISIDAGSSTRAGWF
jgi:hypothetical protein